MRCLQGSAACFLCAALDWPINRQERSQALPGLAPHYGVRPDPVSGIG